MSSNVFRFFVVFFGLCKNLTSGESWPISTPRVVFTQLRTPIHNIPVLRHTTGAHPSQSPHSEGSIEGQLAIDWIGVEFGTRSAVLPSSRPCRVGQPPLPSWQTSQWDTKSLICSYMAGQKYLLATSLNVAFSPLCTPHTEVW